MKFHPSNRCIRYTLHHTTTIPSSAINYTQVITVKKKFCFTLAHKDTLHLIIVVVWKSGKVILCVCVGLSITLHACKPSNNVFILLCIGNYGTEYPLSRELKATFNVHNNFK